MSEFEEELTKLLNKYSKENESDTPDFILSKYISNALDNFNETVLTREQWYGRAQSTETLLFQPQQLTIPFETISIDINDVHGSGIDTYLIDLQGNGD